MKGQKMSPELIAYYEQACQRQSDEMPYPHQKQKEAEYRADFEATAGIWSNRLCKSHEPSSIGDYEDPHTQFAWLGYKAGREAQVKK